MTISEGGILVVINAFY